MPAGGPRDHGVGRAGRGGPERHDHTGAVAGCASYTDRMPPVDCHHARLAVLRLWPARKDDLVFVRNHDSQMHSGSSPYLHVTLLHAPWTQVMHDEAVNCMHFQRSSRAGG